MQSPVASNFRTMRAGAGNRACTRYSKLFHTHYLLTHMVIHFATSAKSHDLLILVAVGSSLILSIHHSYIPTFVPSSCLSHRTKRLREPEVPVHLLLCPSFSCVSRSTQLPKHFKLLLGRRLPPLFLHSLSLFGLFGTYTTQPRSLLSIPHCFTFSWSSSR